MHPRASKPADAYFDRSRLPAETVQRMRPHFGALGITRLAQQTGLDRIGIPVYAAFRPSARTLAVNTGKGIDADTARASAVMEAVEYAIAERPKVETLVASLAELLSYGQGTIDLRRLLPIDRPLDAARSLVWVRGTDLLSGNRILAPQDAVVIDHAAATKRNDFNRSTNGLASGNTQSEAIFHALCELVERDAQTIFSFRSAQRIRESAIAHQVVGDPMVDDLASRIEEAGFTLRLFDLTNDIQVPVYSAVIVDRRSKPSRYLDVSAGSGSHPVAARAAIRAITEAAQTRVTTITGARDDFDPLRYASPFQSEQRMYVDVEPSERTGAGMAAGMPLGSPLSAVLEQVLSRLRNAGIRSVACFPLGGDEFGISVVKLVCSGLEDRPANRHWRPGRRALKAMMDAA